PNIIVNIILVPKFGAVGAAIATSISYIFFFIARTYFSNKNGMSFSVTKHYIVISLLLVGAFLNLASVSWIFIANILLLILLSVFQISTLKQIWTIYKKKDLKGLRLTQNV
ncbi:polysaccharide biosynthesis C-terminal domain-containing protein, partial [Priestia megaterium]